MPLVIRNTIWKVKLEDSARVELKANKEVQPSHNSEWCVIERYLITMLSVLQYRVIRYKRWGILQHLAALHVSVFLFIKSQKFNEQKTLDLAKNPG
jgi:hypothetical protein